MADVHDGVQRRVQKHSSWNALLLHQKQQIHALYYIEQTHNIVLNSKIKTSS